MQTNQLRRLFLDFFKTNEHTVVKSSPLVPYNDPTLLFTNAGMNQFKDVFLGIDTRSYSKAVSVQKCLRAGGKHNDLENVGYTARHHTFFEMLGNFSFGSYFKEEAIKYAWEFLTSPKWLNINPNKLYVTVYISDDQSFNIWHKQIGLELDKIIRIGDKEGGGSDNFWQMGDTGPCGPCTEIFYDHGVDTQGGLPGSKDQDGDRYVEIWNCVFMQFNRDEKGELHKLPNPAVDTGMGLERLAAVMQQVHSNYATDLFVSLIKSAAVITGCGDLSDPSLKVLADHIRAVSFLIADGVLPSNDGRGYVLRRIIRRSVRHGYKIGMRSAFFYLLVDDLVLQMGDAYNELVKAKDIIVNTIKAEEEKFLLTLSQGINLLLEVFATLDKPFLLGSIAFKLYDTYGFPLDLTQDICRENGIEVEVNEFEDLMYQQRVRAKSSNKFKTDTVLEYHGDATMFDGYTDCSIITKVVAIYQNNQLVERISANTKAMVVLERTPFYAEGGGQVGDSGIIEVNGGLNCIFEVATTQKINPQVFVHVGILSLGNLTVGTTVTATYDLHKRLATTRHHSATHLLHKALHEVLGKHAIQKGSLVNENYTRFDFAHQSPLSPVQIKEIERIVNHVILMNYTVETSKMSYEDSQKKGVTALFGEKYSEIVRVVSMGDFSLELCGGTHVQRTGDIGYFRVMNESGVANGVRRIEAISGEVALKEIQKTFTLLHTIKKEFKAHSDDDILVKLNALQAEQKLLHKNLAELNSKIASLNAERYLSEVERVVNNINLLILEPKITDNKAALELMDKLKHKLSSAIIVLSYVSQSKVNLLVGLSDGITDTYDATKIISVLMSEIGGRGGGRRDLAQAGGTKKIGKDKIRDMMVNLLQGSKV